MNLNKNIRLSLLAFLVPLVSVCSDGPENVEPSDVVSCELTDKVDIEDAKSSLVMMLKDIHLQPLEDDGSSLEKISGRSGAIFHLWVTSNDRTVLTVQNLSRPRKFVLSTYFSGFTSDSDFSVYEKTVTLWREKFCET